MISIIENFIPLSISFFISFLVYIIIDRNCFITDKINSKLKFNNRYKTGILFIINLFFIFVVGTVQIFYKDIVSRDAFGIIVGISTGIIVSIVSKLQNVIFIQGSKK